MFFSPRLNTSEVQESPVKWNQVEKKKDMVVSEVYLLSFEKKKQKAKPVERKPIYETGTSKKIKAKKTVQWGEVKGWTPSYTSSSLNIYEKPFKNNSKS